MILVLELQSKNRILEEIGHLLREKVEFLEKKIEKLWIFWREKGKPNQLIQEKRKLLKIIKNDNITKPENTNDTPSDAISNVIMRCLEMTMIKT